MTEAGSLRGRLLRRLALMLAIIGGDPLRFAPFTDLYRRALDEVGRELEDARQVVREETVHRFTTG